MQSSCVFDFLRFVSVSIIQKTGVPHVVLCLKAGQMFHVNEAPSQIIKMPVQEEPKSLFSPLTHLEGP